MKQTSLYIIYLVLSINIQFLTKVKAKELEGLIEENTILCLTETNLKWKSVNFRENIKEISSMRKLNDKKGGGLMVLRKGENVQMTETDTKNEDVMIVECEICSMKFTLFLVYLSVNDNDRNTKIMNEIQQRPQRLEENYIVIGDFNGHIGIIGQQSINENGRKLLNLSEELNLTILNCDLECKGETTWEREQKSTIDFALVNSLFYKHFVEMTIDEDGEEYDLSDHKLITIKFGGKEQNGNKKNEGKYKEITYLKINENTVKHYKKLLENKIVSTDITMVKLEGIIKEAAEKSMRCKMKKKILNGTLKHKAEEKYEPIWFNEDIRKEIKRRKEYNRGC